ncbi:MAG: glycosyltransferase family 4 protein, partial [Usitatibacteraceae bacterium]
YDIVVTHNNIFRPAIAAISAAKSAGIPSVLVPHAHLDDDFYHFPDVHECAREADLVLACPKAACEFYERIGVRNVKYHAPGIDIGEDFSIQDEDAFLAQFKVRTPFFLVLGRKAAAKGYRHVILEIEKLTKTQEVHLVLIGPDDDGFEVGSTNVTYLGAQPRNVVRGALRACIALINMSESESFGIVLLEAWLAGRGVIANADCSAFRDIATHEENALLVSPSGLGAAMRRLLTDRALSSQLGARGKSTIVKYDWEAICKDFVDQCAELCTARE